MRPVTCMVRCPPGTRSLAARSMAPRRRRNGQSRGPRSSGECRGPFPRGMASPPAARGALNVAYCRYYGRGRASCQSTGPRARQGEGTPPLKAASPPCYTDAGRPGSGDRCRRRTRMGRRMSQESGMETAHGTARFTLERIPTGAIQAHCYLLTCTQTRQTLAVDPGAEAPRILARLHDLGTSVVSILHTHGHFDHIAVTV